MAILSVILSNADNDNYAAAGKDQRPLPPTATRHLCLPPHPRLSACYSTLLCLVQRSSLTIPGHQRRPCLEWSTDADNHASGRAHGSAGGRQQPNYRCLRYLAQPLYCDGLSVVLCSGCYRSLYYHGI